MGNSTDVVFCLQGKYVAALVVYDGCAEPVTRTFEVTVSWDQGCIDRAGSTLAGLFTPLAIVLLTVLVLGSANLPPLRWTHPRQIALDARAAAAARRNAEEKASIIAEAVVDGPTLRERNDWLAGERRRRRGVLRATNYDVLLRGVPYREARRRAVGQLPPTPTKRPVSMGPAAAGPTRGRDRHGTDAANARSAARSISVTDDVAVYGGARGGGPGPVTEALDFSSLSPMKAPGGDSKSKKQGSRKGPIDAQTGAQTAGGVRRMTERERRAQMLNKVVASPLDRARALFTLAGDYVREAYDALTRRPRYLFFRFRSQIVTTWMYFFHVPGGWQGVLLRTHLVLELPALVSLFIRPGTPPFARDGDPQTEGLIDAVAPPPLVLTLSLSH